MYYCVHIYKVYIVIKFILNIFVPNVNIMCVTIFHGKIQRNVFHKKHLKILMQRVLSAFRMTFEDINICPIELEVLKKSNFEKFLIQINLTGNRTQNLLIHCTVANRRAIEFVMFSEIRNLKYTKVY